MVSEQPFDENGTLPPGIHQMAWADFLRLFGWNDWRQALVSGMLVAIRHLKGIGCPRIYVDGSFVTVKDYPGDYDACWERGGTNLRLLDPGLVLDPTPGRKRQKAKYGGEWFPADAIANHAGTAFIKFFQTDRSGNRKGIVAIDLGGVP